MCEFWEKIPNMPCFEILKDFSIAPGFWEDEVSNYNKNEKKC